MRQHRVRVETIPNGDFISPRFGMVSSSWSPLRLHDYLRPNWPLVQQVAQLTRTVTVRRTGKITEEVVNLLSDLASCPGHS